MNYGLFPGKNLGELAEYLVDIPKAHARSSYGYFSRVNGAFSGEGEVSCFLAGFSFLNGV